MAENVSYSFFSSPPYKPYKNKRMQSSPDCEQKGMMRSMLCTKFSWKQRTWKLGERA